MGWFVSTHFICFSLCIVFLLDSALHYLYTCGWNNFVCDTCSVSVLFLFVLFVQDFFKLDHNGVLLHMPDIY